ncbi:uncharacterized protein OCT59_026683 [Rhizophagus irregularis]|uniref:Uncharacterized protein n=5 Tax=Rhizophagus irregularis TaxID=588596 RepID=A0A015KCD5_RHIIW|nr:hypothetical protein RirG_047350 [Rhizophagus irregularis DAOM 197198w]UZO06357.1 hypothetical protein OCT59_026683 [Rhizophagus irregularis]GBC16505.1 hypothetical protein GLOIN_2v1584057 [Rhizophagus irregularis DAOM 181602=DAOM 197198]EXX79462.1 hypothetical protein RirG_005350 [Rhizophagus irregularis DAOM 197198w]CAB4393733.1 unnamed protein product [Rhizophagus irregularis]
MKTEINTIPNSQNYKVSKRQQEIYNTMERTISQKSSNFNYPTVNITDITVKVNEYRSNNQTLSKKREYDTDDVMKAILNVPKIEAADLEVEDVNMFADICLLNHILTFDAEQNQERIEVISQILIIMETWRDILRTAYILDQLESKRPEKEKGISRIQIKFEELNNKTSKILDDLEEILAACDANLDDVKILLYDKATLF